MIDKLLADQACKVLEKIVYGSLTLEMPDGTTRMFSGAQSGEQARVVIHRWRLFRAMLTRGDMGLMESYRDGDWSTDDLTAVLSLGMRNMQALGPLLNGNPVSRGIERLRYLTRLNTLKGSRKNIHAHYDIGNDFYKLWLDPGMTYSSAIFSHPEQSLMAAQDNKYQRILEVLDADSGELLEIGCGWGGFADQAVRQGDYRLRGITLSQEQLQYAQARLGKSADFALQDYRTQNGKFDRIVSIEMFEAVGERYWSTYFGKLKALLKEGGKAVVQTITIADEQFERYRRGADVIRTYIFPGGMLPSPARFGEVAESQGLTAGKPYHFGLDYALTLEHWLRNFEARIADLKQQGFDDAFIRIWRFYLASCIATFRSGSTSVMQVELSHA